MRYVPSDDDFQIWLDQKVWDNDSICKRRELLPRIAEDIGKRMNRKGYMMDSRWGYNSLAKWLYAIHIQEIARGPGPCRAIGYPEIQHRDWPEDRDYFEYIMSSENIMDILDKWRLTSDFDPESEVYSRIVFEFSEFLYTYVNLETSKQGMFIANLYGQGTSDSDGENTAQDIYVVEANQGLHGGRGQKV